VLEEEDLIDRKKNNGIKQKNTLYILINIQLWLLKNPGMKTLHNGYKKAQ
jgi:hypothetical protein